MSKKRFWTDRSVVFIVTAEPDFLPQSPWNIPKGFGEAIAHAANVPLEDGRAAVRTFNKAALARRAENAAGWDRRWAIVVASPRDKGFDRLISVRSANTKAKAIGAV
jgi:hypothetical protein